MESSIIIIVNLPGAMGSPVPSTDIQKHTVLVTNKKTKKTEKEIQEICHTDRPIMSCTRNINISGESVTNWIKGNCPSWEKPQVWRKMSNKQRIKSHVDSFNEGFGVSYKTIDDEKV